MQIYLQVKPLVNQQKFTNRLRARRGGRVGGKFKNDRRKSRGTLRQMEKKKTRKRRATATATATRRVAIFLRKIKYVGSEQLREAIVVKKSQNCGLFPYGGEGLNPIP